MVRVRFARIPVRLSLSPPPVTARNRRYRVWIEQSFYSSPVILPLPRMWFRALPAASRAGRKRAGRRQLHRNVSTSNASPGLYSRSHS